ncbi:MAG: hypothetical protein ACK5XN_12765, partial [Bacteroidota bacterium]
ILGKIKEIESFSKIAGSKDHKEIFLFINQTIADERKFLTYNKFVLSKDELEKINLLRLINNGRKYKQVGDLNKYLDDLVRIYNSNINIKNISKQIINGKNPQQIIDDTTRKVEKILNKRSLLDFLMEINSTKNKNKEFLSFLKNKTSITIEDLQKINDKIELIIKENDIDRNVNILELLERVKKQKEEDQRKIDKVLGLLKTNLESFNLFAKRINPNKNLKNVKIDSKIIQTLNIEIIEKVRNNKISQIVKSVDNKKTDIELILKALNNKPELVPQITKIFDTNIKKETLSYNPKTINELSINVRKIQHLPKNLEIIKNNQNFFQEIEKNTNYDYSEYIKEIEQICSMQIKEIIGILPFFFNKLQDKSLKGLMDEFYKYKDSVED